MKNKNFLNLLEKMKEIHEKKGNDYSAEGFYQNFKQSASIAEWFSDPVDKSFAVLIGTKLSRLGNLLSSEDKEVMNESIEDTFLDLTVYCALWASYRKEKG